jgi:hypothetical protein
MSARKARVTVTVDDTLVRAGTRAVRAGLAPSLSAWVNEALLERVERDRRLTALGGAIAAFEAEHGKITPADLTRQRRADRRAAIRVGQAALLALRRTPVP